MLHPPPPGALGSTLWRYLPTGKSLSSGCTFLPRGLLVWVLCLIPPFQFLWLPDSTQFFFPSRICTGGSRRPLRSTCSPLPCKALVSAPH